MLLVVNNGFTSGILRGEHIAEALGLRCHFADFGGVRHDTVLFVKETDRGLMEDAKERRNRIVYDPLDHFCYKDRIVDYGDLVDVVLVPNRACAVFYAEHFPKARYALIPHQWDTRVNGIAPQDRVRAVYIGKGFNCPPGWRGDRITASGEMLQAAPFFNLHLCLNQRAEKQVLLKPATKIATASAVLANVVSYGDPSALELLGTQYPYIVGSESISDVIRRAARDFGGSTWKRARNTMREIRERLCLQSIAALYGRLADGDDSILFDAAAPLKEAA